MHAYSSGNWGAQKFKWLCLNSFAGDCNLALLCQLIALFVGVLSHRQLSTFSLFELDSWRKSVHVIYLQIQISLAKIFKLVSIKLSRHLKHWELKPHWVSTVHGWVEVASHLAESLNRMCLVRFSLWCFSSFDWSGTCRSYFRISKCRPKLTT